jgi:hypothetical protein
MSKPADSGQPTEKIVYAERRLKLTPRTCAACGHSFHGWGRQRFCSPTCQKRWDYHQHAEQRRTARRARYQEQLRTQSPPADASDDRT